MSAAPVLTVVQADHDLLAACLRMDHLVVRGSRERAAELTSAWKEDRMRVAVRNDELKGYAVVAPWFLGATFLQLVYVSSDSRRQGVGTRLLADFERRQARPLFTSTNASNLPMRALLTSRGWKERGELHGLDVGDPEIFFGLPV